MFKYRCIFKRWSILKRTSIKHQKFRHSSKNLAKTEYYPKPIPYIRRTLKINHILVKRRNKAKIHIFFNTQIPPRIPHLFFSSESTLFFSSLRTLLQGLLEKVWHKTFWRFSKIELSSGKEGYFLYIIIFYSIIALKILRDGF